MQVFDLKQLLTIDPVDMPVEFSNTAHYNGFGNSHNIVINEDTGFAYGVGTNTFSGGLHFVDISDPANPTAAGGFNGDGYTHDAQCVVCKCLYTYIMFCPCLLEIQLTLHILVTFFLQQIMDPTRHTREKRFVSTTTKIRLLSLM